MAAAVAFSAAGCKSALAKREPNLSELRDELMKAEGERMSAELISGVREQPFVIDGAPGEKCDFTVITVSPNGFSETAEFDYILEFGGTTAEGELSRHPLRDTFSAELGIRVRGSATLTVIGPDDYRESFALRSAIGPDDISAADALEIAENRLKGRIKELTSGGSLRAEVYLRFLDNPITTDGGYYWYVAYVPSEYEVYAVLIDPATGEIAAVRE